MIGRGHSKAGDRSSHAHTYGRPNLARSEERVASRATQVTLQKRHRRLGSLIRLRIDVVEAAEYGVFPRCFPSVFRQSIAQEMA